MSDQEKQERECSACHQLFPATAEHFVLLRKKMRNGELWTGWSGECRTCRNKRFKPYYVANRSRLVAKATAAVKKRRETDPAFREKDRQWSRESARRRFEDKEQRAVATARDRQWRKDNPERVKAFKWSHPAMKRMRAMERYARQNHPPWANRKHIESIYAIADFLTRNTGIAHEVDHYYPLVNKNSCGLHVPWNMRVITAAANQAKGNRMPEGHPAVRDWTALL
jgi:hypothetical protein